jgi:hypothetical protein
MSTVDQEEKFINAVSCQLGREKKTIIPLSSIKSLKKETLHANYVKFWAYDIFDNHFLINEKDYEIILDHINKPITVERLQKCLEILTVLNKLKKETDEYVKVV